MKFFDHLNSNSYKDANIRPADDGGFYLYWTNDLGTESHHWFESHGLAQMYVIHSNLARDVAFYKHQLVDLLVKIDRLEKRVGVFPLSLWGRFKRFVG